MVNDYSLNASQLKILEIAAQILAGSCASPDGRMTEATAVRSAVLLMREASIQTS